MFEISNDTTLTDISRIWQPFYVGESSRDKNFSGTGLGLATVKSLAEQLGYKTQATLSNGTIKFKIDFGKSWYLIILSKMHFNKSSSASSITSPAYRVIAKT